MIASDVAAVLAERSHRLAALVGWLLILLAASGTARASTDPRDAPGDPLDLRDVSFTQRGTVLWLRVRTEGPWSAGMLADNGLCLALVRSRVIGRVCLGSDGEGAVVARWLPAGSAGEARPIRARVVRPNGRTVRVHFRPRALGLRFGRVRWFVESNWTAAGACAAVCTDRAPDRGDFTTRIGALGGPRCFGAAARVTRPRCVNRALARTVTPSPWTALVMPEWPCRPVERTGGATPCVFGAFDEAPDPQIALIGDSHAAHLRSAFEVVAQARGWHAVSLTRPGCAFSTEAYPDSAPERCLRRTEEVLAWLEAHPGVHSVFTSAAAGRGLGTEGFLAAWRRVPPTVRRIYVIPDVPRVRQSTASCVLRVLRRRARSTGACSVPRSEAFVSDPLRSVTSTGRVRVIDLARVFCSASRCFPVIGGAYVYKDANHLNRAFATTLGPVILGLL